MDQFIEQFGSMPHSVNLEKQQIFLMLFFFHRILNVFFFFFKHFSCPDVSSYSTITISYIKKEKNRLSQKARMILLKTIFLGFS